MDRASFYEGRLCGMMNTAGFILLVRALVQASDRPFWRVVCGVLGVALIARALWREMLCRRAWKPT